MQDWQDADSAVRAPVQCGCAQHRIASTAPTRQCRSHEGTAQGEQTAAQWPMVGILWRRHHAQAQARPSDAAHCAASASSSIRLAQSRHRPQQVATFSSLPSCSIDATPRSTAARIWWSVTPLQMQTYMPGVPSIACLNRVVEMRMISNSFTNTGQVFETVLQTIA